MKLVVGMNSGLGLIGCHSNDCALTVWDPTSQGKIKALENIQRRAARFVTNNYTDRTPGCVTNNKSKSSISFGSYIVNMFIPE
jgi:hypothetical protein